MQQLTIRYVSRADLERQINKLDSGTAERHKAILDKHRTAAMQMDNDGQTVGGEAMFTLEV